jgi:hypothetical protein
MRSTTEWNGTCWRSYLLIYTGELVGALAVVIQDVGFVQAAPLFAVDVDRSPTETAPV